MTIEFKYIKNINEKDVKLLYDDAEWIAYTKDMPNLMEAIHNSLEVITAWEDEKLVGLIRAVGDVKTILYVQDILVLQSYKRKAIGSRLLNLLLDKYSNVRQKVLLTDESIETRKFYEANGFISCDKGETVAFAKFN